MAETTASDGLTAPSASPQPLSQRLIAAAPFGPVWAGLAIAGLQYGACLAYHALLAPLGTTSVTSERFWQLMAGPNAVMALLIGYAPAAMAVSRRATAALLAELQPVLVAPAARSAALQRELAGYPHAWLRATGAAGVLVILTLSWFDPSMRSLREQLSSLEELWLLWINTQLAWMLTRTFSHELWMARQFSRIGERLVEVDLLDLRPLAPFARRGLHSVLLWVVGASIYTLLFAGGWASDAAGWLMLVLTVVAAMVLVLPVLGVHRRIRATKRVELGRLGRALRAEHEALLAGAAEPAREAALRVPALAALRAQVEGVREWPFDASTLLRFVLYVAIGLGSWLGAAIVERLLDLTLAAR